MTNEPRAFGGNVDNHLVVQRNVYHQRAGHQPYGLDRRGTHSFVRMLRSDRPVHVVDPFVVGPKWQAIPLGYCETVGLVVILNRGGRQSDTVPTSEESLAMAEKVVEVSLGGLSEHSCDLLVPPGESADFTPARPLIHVRSKPGAGLLECCLEVYPK